MSNDQFKRPTFQILALVLFALTLYGSYNLGKKAAFNMVVSNAEASIQNGCGGDCNMVVGKVVPKIEKYSKVLRNSTQPLNPPASYAYLMWV